ncbi:MAG: hypothetical protein KF681_01460 [Bdellovibrionaceae bacterium]|nr:hypothetical protein [Pseudobdellovibrionaceae bacterium]
MKTVFTLGALLVLSLQSQALPAMRLAAETNISEQEVMMEGTNDLIQRDDIFVFTEGFKFRRHSTGTFLGPSAGGCHFAMTGAPADVAEVQLTKVLRWKVTSVQKLEYGTTSMTLNSPEVPGRKIELSCPNSRGNDLADLARAGAKVVRPLRIEKVSYEMPIDSYDRRGTIYDGQTGDRTPRPRPGQR